MKKIKRKQINFGGTDSQYVRGDGELASFPDISEETEGLLYEEITYSELKNKIVNNQLSVGTKYRITDYVTTTVQENTQSANHQFDLLVTAIDNNKLDYKASALLTDGDTYFSSAGSNLSKWQLWYDINNDTTKYAWADSTNGKGVIYRMIDEFNNDCPYDFKNIMFKRKLTNGSLDNTSGTDTFVFTFNMYDNGTCVDVSTQQTVYVTDVDSYRYTHNNTIKPSFANDDDYHVADKLVLNDNVFLNLNDHEYYGTVSNTIEVNCALNTFGTNCSGNILGINCINNILGNYCTNNIFDIECFTNILEDHCERNIFGSNCSSNILSSNCYNNVFGIGCTSNYLGNYCTINRFAGSCGGIKFGNNCSENFIGIACQAIVFKPSKNNNNENSYYRKIIVEHGNSYIHLTANNSSVNDWLQNIYIAQGCSGITTSYTTISTITTNRSYRTTVGRNSQGNIRIYNEDDPVEGGSSTEDGVLNIYVNDDVVGQFSANQSSETSVDIDFEAGTGISLEGNSQNGIITISEKSNHTVINRQTILTAEHGQTLRYYDVRCDLNGSVLKVGDLSDFVSPNRAYSYENKYVWTKQSGETGKYAGICKVQSTEGKYVFKIDFYDSTENKTTTHFFGVVADSPVDATFTFISTCNWEIIVRLNSDTHRLLAYLKIPDEFVGTITLTPLRRNADSMNNEGLTSSFDYSTGTTIRDYYWYTEITQNDGVQNVNTVTELAENAPETSSSSSGNYLRTPTGNYYVNVIGDFGGNLQVGSKVSDSVVNDYYIHTIEKRLQDFATAAAIYTLLNLPQPTVEDEGKTLVVNSSGQYELVDGTK